MKSPLICLLLTICLFTFACRSGSETAEDTVITRLYESDNSHSILYDTGSNEALTLITDPGALFIILYHTPGNEWLIVERSPATPGPGRIETEHLLFHIPGRRQIDIEELHPSLSSYGITFLEVDGKLHLITPLKGSPETVSIPLPALLEGRIPDIPLTEEPKTLPHFDPDAEPQYGARITENKGVVLELKLGTPDDQPGEALVPRLTDSGERVNSIISYTADNGKIYIVESIQFRVLIYDYDGNFIKAVNYPSSLPQREVIDIRDIATDGEFLFLLSPGDNSVYVIDSETEDIAAIIEEGSSQSGRFIDLAAITVDHNGYLRIHDRRHDGNGEIYTYRRQDNDYRYTMTEQYSQYGQMVPGIAGTVYSATVIDDSYKVTRDEGDYVIRNRTPMGLVSAEVRGTDADGNVYVMCEEFGGQIAGPFNLKVITPRGEESYSLLTSFWDGGRPVMRRVVVTPSGEVFDAYYDGDAFRDLEEEELIVTKLVVERLK